MSTVITFLGKGKKGGYSEANYRFADGTVTCTPYFGLALAEHENAGLVRILGTAGSMWDALILDKGHTEGFETEWENLEEAVHQNAVDQPMLDKIADRLNQRGTRQHELKLIPYGLNDVEQIDILRALTEDLPNEKIILDVTHGFRHLPMLGLLSVFYLRAARQQHIDAIYYGAFEQTDATGHTPVLRLDGLLKLYDWIRALENFNKDGDYGSFQHLFTSEYLPGDLLAEASFLERIANASLGSQKLGSAMRQIAAAEEISPAAALFRPLLEERTAWHKKNGRAERERKLALDYLQRGDYLRASQFGYESFVSATTREDINEYDARKEADDYLSGQADTVPYDSPANFLTLKNLRNALAHGIMDSAPSGKRGRFIKKITGQEKMLRDWLAKALKNQ